MYKHTNSKRKLLYRPLGGGLVLRLAHYKISKKNSEIPCISGGGSQLLIESP